MQLCNQSLLATFDLVITSCSSTSDAISIKIIWWDRDGLAIFMKRLEAGTVQRLECASDTNSLLIDQAQLSMLLSGIDASNIKRRKRYRVEPETMALLSS